MGVHLQILLAAMRQYPPNVDGVRRVMFIAEDVVAGAEAEIAALEAASRASQEAGRAVDRRTAEWVVKHTDWGLIHDHACHECMAKRSHRPMVVVGFRCVPHAALAALRSAPPEPREDVRDYGEGYRDGLICAMRKATARGQKDLADDIAIAAMAPAPAPDDDAPHGKCARCGFVYGSGELVAEAHAQWHKDQDSAAPPPEDSGAREATTAPGTCRIRVSAEGDCEHLRFGASGPYCALGTENAASRDRCTGWFNVAPASSKEVDRG